jgi:Flp pilus assembly protein TadD
MNLSLSPVVPLAALLALLGGSGCSPAKSKAEAEVDARVVEAMNRGVSLMGQYQYDAAVQAFETAVAASPALLDAKVNLAMALFNRGRKEDMEPGTTLLDEVLAKEPAHPRALYFKAIVLQHLGNAEAAVACVAKVTQLRPEDAAAWYLLGLCQQRLGQPASEALLRAVRLRPRLYSAYYQLYQSALRAGETDLAKDYLEKFKAGRESPLGESIEMPQYNQMGELALVLPLPAVPLPPLARSRYQSSPAQSLGTSPLPASPAATVGWGGVALGDLNGDGAADLAWVAGSPGRVTLWWGDGQGGFTDGTAAAGLAALTNALSVSMGDFDNDEIPDLFIAGISNSHLFKGSTNGVFSAVPVATELARGLGPSRSGVFLDADHDGDLDLFLCGVELGSGSASRTGNQLWGNNGDGTFTNHAAGASLECAGSRTVLVLPGDLDGDRDADLVVLREGEPAKVFLNQLLGRYVEAPLAGLIMRGDWGGALQDVTGDGLPDLVVLGGSPPQLALFVGDGRGGFQPNSTFDQPARAAASWGPLRAVRVVDLDLDGDLDIACFSGQEGHALMNDGAGRFALISRVWRAAAGSEWVAVELLDANGDTVADLLALERGAAWRFTFSAGDLTPPSTSLQVMPTGVRSRDNRTRSPASGYGVKLVTRAGRYEQTRLHSGLHGGVCQSLAPVVLGLGGARQVDYLSLAWPDGVAQVETALAAGQLHRIPEMQRKISSCPVLFTWNGNRFEFITDFAGVGGLGYFVAPGESAPPQVEEHIKIAPGQLRPRNGVYEVRVTEPMEESAYVDRLELLVVDHPATHSVFPDERLAISGPPPSHELLVVEQPIFPVQAADPDGRDCLDSLLRVDRVYAYEPPLDRRYIGFCRPHTLELDFADRLAQVEPTERVFLFLNGFIEYPYSQTVYAASQSRVGWEPIRIDRLGEDGRWRTMVPDGGVPGGMARTFTIELTGLVSGPHCRLRLTTNLEVYYDQAYVGRHAGLDQVTVSSAPLLGAELRRVGFAREYSPDGRLPLLYDYHLVDATAPFHVLRGAYTRYGPVEALLQEFDDRYVRVGPGDEIALRFAANAPDPAEGMARSFILISHAYCKDMDLYTATPQTLDPLPFRGMSRYPYPPSERFPDTPELRTDRARYHTRWME